MSTPNVRVNTFLKRNEKPYIDPLSKFYIIFESALGLNRLPAMLNKMRRVVIPVVVIYSIFLSAVLIYFTYIDNLNIFATTMGVIKYLFCAVFSFLTWMRTERYYKELDKFDVEIGCRPNTSSDSIKNLIIMLIFNLIVGAFFTVCYYYMFICLSVPMIPLSLIHCIEVFYYGHLLSLLTPRLRLINYYIHSELSNGKLAARPNIEEFVSFKYKDAKNSDMKKLMDLYHTIINAYDFLIDAIKWQLLVVLVTSFITTLTFCYHVSLSIIRNENPFIDIVTDMGMTATEMIPLFSPCMFGDRVHNEVRRLRELLASRLYENKLDKPGRSAARALLALTEARDLSFSLLRMLQIDISLPFKFIGLLVTYLIILLQFEKVINPPSSQ